MVVFDFGWFYDWSAYQEGTSQPELMYTLVTAVQASPLRIAMSFLRNVYWFTFAAVLMAFLTVRKQIKKGLTDPLRELNNGMKEGWTLLSDWGENVTWQEPCDLRENYQIARADLRRQKDEITRLKTALDYAKTAEVSRRQMTSNIAHELKTPLAVIHSYAEGLKEHIAEDKRDKYVDVILSEVERTDSMVLEMLDLSRLEAGKVKLSRDEFSLAELAKAIFEKLQMAAEAKQLQISYEFLEQCTIIADENRIAQVVENFATNAVKYTPVGGRVAVKIQSDRGKTIFSVENDSKPLPNEVLAKVWDTFYRVDEARSESGTGLGLAIAKNIVELHGGKCSVRNTKTGVEFMFAI